MKRLGSQGWVVALGALLCGCVAEQQNGEAVALMREAMIESAKSSDGQKSLESPERAVRAVGDWRGSGEEGDG